MPIPKFLEDDDDDDWPPVSPELSPSQIRKLKREKEQYLNQCNYPFCEDSRKYEKMAKVGQGTFGEVFKARNRHDPTQIVAMKKILMEKEKDGFPITALREIRILKQLKHENVVRLLEICQSKEYQPNNLNRTTFYLVFEFCEHDLAGILSNLRVRFELGEIKQMMSQILNGIFILHVNHILHRDIKAANILITNTGILKIADFGLARAFSKQKNSEPNRYTNRVVTLWYRPPELLLGEHDYGPPIDIWGVGCIMAEMWTRCPILPGNSEATQLKMISQLCGSISPEVWPKVVTLDLYDKIELTTGHKRQVINRLRSYVRDKYALDLLDKFLTLDPEQRIDADQALGHDFFWTDPMPCNLTKLLAQLTTNNFEFLLPRRKINHHFSTNVPKIKPSVSTTSGVQDRIY